MCGICGWYSPSPLDLPPDTIDRMTDLLSHRGPDGRGIWKNAYASLGHRRLSILDLAGGQQPMRSADGTVVVTFNGEIFNYLELADSIAAPRRGTSDTAVLVEGFRERGPKFFRDLNGQYAAAFYEERAERLTLVRDPRGEKPLFLRDLPGGGVAFASELKALLLLGEVLGLPRELDPRALARYFALNYVPFGESLVRGIKQLEPGHSLTIGRNGRSLQPIDFGVPSRRVEFGAALTEATRIRLRSDVPVGIFLSSGLDSTSVLAAARSLGATPVPCVARFAEPEFDESPAALKLCADLGLEAVVCDVRMTPSDIPGLMEKIVWHADTPLADSSALPVYLLSREARRHVTVALSGDGGDELLGGYLTYRATKIASAIPRFLRRVLHRTAPFTRFMPETSGKVGRKEQLDRFLRSLHLPPGAAHFAWNGMLHRSEILELLSPGLRAEIDTEEVFLELAQAFGVSPEHPSQRELREADLGGYLTDDILVKVDRMSMAHGLEMRPAFLDPRVVEAARALPEHEFGESKQPLRRFLSAKLPEYSPPSRKLGFSIPIHRWLRGELAEWGRELIESSSFAEELLERRAARALWREHQEGIRARGFELWGLFAFLEWRRTVFSRRFTEL